MDRDQARRFAAACVAAAVAVLIDQASKAWALRVLSERERIPLLGDLFGLQLAFNPGALLSLGSGATWLITLLGSAMTVVLIIAATRARTIGWAIGIGLVLGGAVGNLIDRLFSPPAFGRGRVTDFLAYGDWFIGNAADLALGVGVIVLLASLWARHRTTQASTTNEEAPTATMEAAP